jgi:hypothetical protein
MGLSNGDLVIRQFYNSIKNLIPPELADYIVLARDQADIWLGVNKQKLDKIQNSTEKKLILAKIQAWLSSLKNMSEFELELQNTNFGDLAFTMPCGVGTTIFENGDNSDRISNSINQAFDHFCLNLCDLPCFKTNYQAYYDKWKSEQSGIVEFGSGSLEFSSVYLE